MSPKGECSFIGYTYAAPGQVSLGHINKVGCGSHNSLDSLNSCQPLKYGAAFKKNMKYEKIDTDTGEHFLGDVKHGEVNSFIRRLLQKAVGSLKCLLYKENEKLWKIQRAFSAFLLATPFEISRATWTVMQFVTVHIAGNRWDANTYRFYALAEGAYDVKAAFGWITTVAMDLSVHDAKLAVYKNNEFYKILDYEGICYYFGGYANQGWFLSGSCLVYLKCGEYLDIRFRHGNGSNADMRSSTAQSYYGYLDIHFAGDNCQLTEAELPTFPLETS